MAETTRPDDLVYQVDNRWFGTKDVTFPVAATYVGWMLWLTFFTIQLVGEATLGIGFGWLLLREVTIAAALSTACTQAMTYDKPIRALAASAWGEVKRLATPNRRPPARVNACLRVAVVTPSESVKPRRPRPPRRGGLASRALLVFASREATTAAAVIVVVVLGGIAFWIGVPRG